MSTVSLVLNRMIQALGRTVQDGLCVFHHPSPTRAHTHNCSLLICFPSQRPLQPALGHWVCVSQMLPSGPGLRAHSWPRIIVYWMSETRGGPLSTRQAGSVCDIGRLRQSAGGRSPPHRALLAAPALACITSLLGPLFALVIAKHWW